MRHIIPISGKDSLTTAIVQTTHKPNLNYEYIFNDVGSELPETYAWLKNVEKKLDIEVTRIEKNLLDLVEHYEILPSHQRRFCTRETKIEPMEEYLNGDEPCTIYYGLRADEPERSGYQNSRNLNLTAENPLRDFEIGIKTVWRILSDRELLPPGFYWDELYKRVEKKVGHKDIKDRLAPWVFRNLFSGRSRTNCYHCFYQRHYEWVWTLLTHPDLYWKARDIEVSTGGDGFTWCKEYSLDEIAERKDKIIENRADDVAKMVSRIYQYDLFGRPVIEQTLMDMTNCGMFCGK